MKNTKKLLSLVLCFVLFHTLSNLTFSAETASESFIEGKYTYTVSYGVATIIGYNDIYNSPDDAHVVIPSVLGGYPVTTIGYHAFEDCTNILSIQLSDTVTTIEKYAFEDIWLREITLSDSVTEIGEGAFARCSDLKTVKFGNGLKNIGKYAFAHCTSLEEIVIPEGVETMGLSVFSNCYNLKKLHLPKSLEFIENNTITYWCRSLETLTVASGNKAYHSAGNCLIETATKTMIGGTINSIIPADGSVTKIESQALNNLYHRTVLIPDCITEIENATFDYAYCLTDIYYYGTKAEWDKLYSGNIISNYEVNYHYLNDPDYKIESFDSSLLVLLRKILIQSENPQTMAIDFNHDKSVDLKDLISLKRALIS